MKSLLEICCITDIFGVITSPELVLFTLYAAPSYLRKRYLYDTIHEITPLAGASTDRTLNIFFVNFNYDKTYLSRNESSAGHPNTVDLLVGCNHGYSELEVDCKDLPVALVDGGAFCRLAHWIYVGQLTSPC
jgi:hypothetical protein